MIAEQKPPPWHETAEGVAAKAVELGVSPGNDLQSPNTFRQRVMDAYERHEKQAGRLTPDAKASQIFQAEQIIARAAAGNFVHPATLAMARSFLAGAV